MQRIGTQSIGEALKEYIKEVNLSESFKKFEIYEAWEKAVGEQISRYTINLFFNQGILYVTLSSSIIRNQVYYNLDGIRLKINQLMGSESVAKIVLK